MEEQSPHEVTENPYKAPYSHSQIKRMVQSFIDGNAENAEKCRRDRRYFDGDQISAAMKV